MIFFFCLFPLIWSEDASTFIDTVFKRCHDEFQSNYHCKSLSTFEVGSNAIDPILLSKQGNAVGPQEGIPLRPLVFDRSTNAYVTDPSGDLNSNGEATKVLNEIFVKNDETLEINKKKKNYRAKTIKRGSDEVYPVCDKANTHLEGRNCVCLPNFEFGDPYTIGCFSCNDECNSESHCVAQGICQCPDFTTGDGKNSCLAHVPSPYSAYRGPHGSYIAIMIDAVQWPINSHAFCGSGDQIVNATLIAPNRIECKPFRGLLLKRRVRISWDPNGDWSEEIDIDGIFDGVILFAVLGLGATLVVFSGMLYMKNQRFSSPPEISSLL